MFSINLGKFVLKGRVVKIAQTFIYLVYFTLLLLFFYLKKDFLKNFYQLVVYMLGKYWEIFFSMIPPFCQL